MNQLLFCANKKLFAQCVKVYKSFVVFNLSLYKYSAVGRKRGGVVTVEHGHMCVYGIIYRENVCKFREAHLCVSTYYYLFQFKNVPM